MTIEDNFKQLDEILSKMEDKETTLEESFNCYEQGMKLIKECHASLDEVEKKIIVLSGNEEPEDEGLPF